MMNTEDDSDTEEIISERTKSEEDTTEIIHSPRDIAPNVEGNTQPPPRGGHSACYLPQIQQLVLFGGSSEEGHNNELFYLSALNGKWSNMSHLQNGEVPAPRYAHTMSVVLNKLVLFGGFDATNFFGDVHVLDPNNQRWKQMPINSLEKPAARYAHSCVALGDKLVVFGGFGANKQIYNDLWVLDVWNGNWVKPELQGEAPPPRGYHTASLVGHKIVIYGGKNGSIYYNDCHVLDTREYFERCFIG